MQGRSVKDVKHVVVKNQYENQDANSMAQLQSQKTLQSNHDKRNRIKDFMNTTKSNASRIYKEQQEKKNQHINVKKIMSEKQKYVKAKYTVVEKKKLQSKGLNVQPTKVDWKKAASCKGITVPHEKIPIYESSDEEGSGIDSQYEQSNIRTPEQLIKQRADVRSKMMKKWGQKG